MVGSLVQEQVVAQNGSDIKEPLPPKPPSPWRGVLTRVMPIPITIGLAATLVLAGGGYMLGRSTSGASALEARLDTAQDAANDARSEISDLEGDVADLRSEKSALETENADLSSRLASVQASQDAVADSTGSKKITVDFAEWEGLFTLKHATLDFSYDYATVLGQLEYLGGGDCDLGYVELDSTFFKDGALIGQGMWNATSISAGSPIPVDVSGDTGKPADRAEVVMTDASCA